MARKEMPAGWKYEFPDFKRMPAKIVKMIADESVEDESWHNDVCPRVTVSLEEDFKVTMWVDFINKKDREFTGLGRFIVYVENDNGQCCKELSTDDLEVAIKKIAEFKLMGMHDLLQMEAEWQEEGAREAEETEATRKAGKP